MDFLKKKEQVLNGEYNALELFTELNELEKAIKAAKAEIMDEAITEFDKYGEKTLKEFGFEISMTQSGKYDYSNSAEWNDLKDRMKSIEDKMKAAYQNGGSFIDDESGELFEPASYKSNKASLRLKKAK